MDPRAKRIVCALAAIAAAPMLHAYFFTWVFQFDAARLAQQQLQYAEEMNKVNQSELQLQNDKARQKETAAAEAAFGPKLRGNLDTDNAVRDANLAKDAEDLKAAKAARALVTTPDSKVTGYDMYLENVTTWRAQMEGYRLKADALARDANSREMTLTEWMAMQTQFRLVLGQIEAAAAAAANEQAELKAIQLQERNALREKLLQLQQLRQTQP